MKKGLLRSICLLGVVIFTTPAFGASGRSANTTPSIISYDGINEECIYTHDWEQDDRDLFEIVEDLPAVGPVEEDRETFSIDPEAHEAFSEAGLLDEKGDFDFDKYAELPTLNSDRMPQSVIGTDDRLLVGDTLKTPYRYIVYILSNYNGKNYRGTGFMVGKNAVGTCGHNLYSQERGWASNVTVFAARNGSVYPYGSAVKEKLYVSSDWLNTGAYVSDWGLIELQTDLGLKTGYFGLRSYSKNVAGSMATISGYPATALGMSTTQMYAHSEKIAREVDKRLFYPIDTTGGNSGSPIYVEGDLLIGIHAYGGSTTNSGRRIDRVIFDFYKSFR